MDGYGSRGFGGERSGGPGNPMNGFGPAFGRAGAGLWEVMDQLRSAFDQRPAPSRMARGDVRTAVLALLAEQPMHGYQIIQEIEDRSEGAWKPSAGSVYPTLQLLADEGLIEAEERSGRKTYSLTDAGREAAEGEEKPLPWETGTAKPAPPFGALPKAGVDLAAAVAQVQRSGSPAQIDQAVAVLDEARRRLYTILAD